MLVIRMQRTGRKGHAQFRVVVQDSRRTPTSGRVVAALGHYNPHTKESSLDKEKALLYLEHGAQPSDRAARLLQAEGVKLPKWVKLEANKQRAIRNLEKLRKNRPSTDEAIEDKPAEEAAVPVEAVEKAPVDEAAAAPDPKAAETSAEQPSEAKAEDTPDAVEEESDKSDKSDTSDKKSDKKSEEKPEDKKEA
ncbi:MAG TPA: 30S ribosomal protein S16 [Candidatus Limnocylindria bacterium]|nr:30S ribosomal protein S16 [Candidatus Limnocylindria bacterium]